MTHTAGLYVHIPYCRALCHYCDFAKTANFGQREAELFFERLEEHTQGWLAVAQEEGLLRQGATPGEARLFRSVFLGGGTPSLFSNGYTGFMQLVTPWLAPGAEVSLEANPDDVTAEALATWQGLGFTRLSMGVQTFKELGLKVMHRIHSGAQAESAVHQALRVFSNVNIDLIYGWPGQTLSDFADDLGRAVGLGIPHLSLYTLTFESRTPLGRAALRGKVDMQSDEHLAAMYDLACEMLGNAGYLHEEVSNWALPGSSCAHNWLYWDDAPFIGIGPGAHGYLPSSGTEGVRYFYPRSDRMFLKQSLAHLDSSHHVGMDSLSKVFGVEVETDRDLEVWFTEYVGSSLRTCRGTSLSRIEQRLGRKFAPTAALETALTQGLCHMTKSSSGEERIIFTPPEWYREVAWAVELLGSFPR